MLKRFFGILIDFPTKSNIYASNFGSSRSPKLLNLRINTNASLTKPKKKQSTKRHKNKVFGSLEVYKGAFAKNHFLSVYVQEQTT
jgi:hypothetical protein